MRGRGRQPQKSSQGTSFRGESAKGYDDDYHGGGGRRNYKDDYGYHHYEDDHIDSYSRGAHWGRGGANGGGVNNGGRGRAQQHSRDMEGNGSPPSRGKEQKKDVAGKPKESPKEIPKDKQPQPTQDKQREGGRNKRKGKGDGDYGTGEDQPSRIFEPHASPEDLKSLVLKGEVIIGTFRVTSYAHSWAFVRNPLIPCDILIDGWKQRNRALPGDIVAVKLAPVEEWNTEINLLDKTMIGMPMGAGAGDPVEQKKKYALKLDLGATQRLLKATLGESIPDWAFTKPPQSLYTSKQAKGVIIGIVNRIPDLKLRTTVVRLQRQATHASPADRGTSATTSVESAPPKTHPHHHHTTGQQVDSDEEIVVYKAPCPESEGSEAEPEAASSAPLPVKPAEAPAPAPKPSQSNNLARCVPDDTNYPFMDVYRNSIPEGVNLENELMLVSIDSWHDRCWFPRAKFVRSLGSINCIQAETEALLASFHIEHGEFCPEAQEECNRPFIIPDADELRRQGRRDLRNSEFCCTIDPPTARDLDDALSIEALGNGTYRVGVHIADVGHFVEMGSKTDEEARKRFTTTYLVQQAFPMLPHQLSENYCSLNPGTDRFAFSCIWTVTENGKILSEWMGKSVIHLYCRLSYPDATVLMEDKYDDEFKSSLLMGDYVTPSLREEFFIKVLKSVKNLNKLAKKMQKTRIERGCLRLNRGKLVFKFPPMPEEEKTSQFQVEDYRFAPSSAFLYEMKDANFLVEEFMLLANMRVARKLQRWFPVQAMLRRHGGPLKAKAEIFKSAMNSIGLNVDLSSGPALSRSLLALKEQGNNPGILAVIQVMTTFCMQLAGYCCPVSDSDVGFFHYGLNEELYTHFTSPIRRYADIVVHRQLAEVVRWEREGLTPPPRVDAENDADISSLHPADFGDLETVKENTDACYSTLEVAVIADKCNEKKETAKKAGEASGKLFLCWHIKSMEGRYQSLPDGDPAKPKLPYLEATAVCIRVDIGKKLGLQIYVIEYALTEIFTDRNIQDQDFSSIAWGEKGESPQSCTLNWKDGSKSRIVPLTKMKCRLMCDTGSRLTVHLILEKPEDEDPMTAWSRS